MMKNLLIKLTLFLGSTVVFFDAQAGKITPELIESLKPAIISIKTRETRKAYGNAATTMGTGFLVDKENGIILTNRHIAAVNNPASYEATWEDGSLADLKLIWNDPTNDFAFLKIDLDKIPSNAPQVKFSRIIKVGQDVVIIGNNEGIGHSVQEGKVNDLFTFISTDWQSQALSLNLNTKGGSSGSPVFNEDGEVIALNFAGSDTSANSMPISYIEDALENIREGRTPARFSTGALLATINLGRAQDYYQYSNPNMKSFLIDIAGARNRLLQVDSLLPGIQLLEVGDIIEKVNGKIVGPDHYLVEKELNQSEGKPVTITICRNGDFIDLKVPVFNLNDALCSKMLVFGDTVFASVDPLMSFQTGMPINSVCIGSKNPGCLFEDVPQIAPDLSPLVQVQKIMGMKINTLQDVIESLPKITKAKKFNYVIKDYSFIYQNTTYHTSQKELSLIADYSPEHYPAPAMIGFDKEQHDWVRQSLDQ